MYLLISLNSILGEGKYCVGQMYLDLTKTGPINNALMKCVNGKAISKVEKKTEVLKVYDWLRLHKQFLVFQRSSTKPQRLLSTCENLTPATKWKDPVQTFSQGHPAATAHQSPKFLSVYQRHQRQLPGSWRNCYTEKKHVFESWKLSLEKFWLTTQLWQAFFHLQRAEKCVHAKFHRKGWAWQPPFPETRSCVFTSPPRKWSLALDQLLWHLQVSSAWPLSAWDVSLIPKWVFSSGWSQVGGGREKRYHLLLTLSCGCWWDQN